MSGQEWVREWGRKVEDFVKTCMYLSFYIYHFNVFSLSPPIMTGHRRIKGCACVQPMSHRVRELICYLSEFVPLKKQKKEHLVLGACTYSAKLDSSNRIAQLVQRR